MPTHVQAHLLKQIHPQSPHPEPVEGYVSPDNYDGLRECGSWIFDRIRMAHVNHPLILSL